ncbi:capsular biosynthesis protein [Mesobacillus foraminis]|uniref:YveK family protein n=1 Tax=Mesobacillus foraminis TaxID=279826 RepID=UPI001BEB236B|nr:Wzz/FepE/Etk N-terminal domain-containing protein [Mesobacillus foraminis]MBT2758424.1 capsular biosynthesis protein [Mesobacillus foraminis]
MNNFNEPNYKAKDINLKEIFILLKKRAWIILLLTIISTGIGFVYNSSSTTYMYSTSARIYIDAEGAGLMKTLQVIIKDSSVLEKVVEELKLNRSPEALANQITVQNVEESQVISISVVDTDPTLAADIANTTAEIFRKEAPDIVDFKAMKELSEAKVPTNPLNEKSNRPVILAFIIGLATGIGFVFLLDSLDNSFRSNREVEILLELPVLGRVSKMNSKNINTKSNIQSAVNMGGETSVTK